MNQPWNVHPLPEAKNSGGVELEDQWFEVYRISVWSVRIEVPGRTCGVRYSRRPLFASCLAHEQTRGILKPRTGAPAPPAGAFVLSYSPPPRGPVEKPNFRAGFEETCHLVLGCKSSRI